MRPSKSLNHQEFAATLARMAGSKDHGQMVARPKFDFKEAQERAKESGKGRKVADYKIALEHEGFTYVPKHCLPPFQNGFPQPVGLWRNDGMKLALTDDDVVGWFETPEELVRWVEKERMTRRLSRAGLHAPK